MKGLAKEQLVMLKSLLSALVLATFSVNSLAVELKGHLTQGGLVTGKLSDVQSVSLNDTPLKLSKNGDFVFGFGRDAKANHTLSWIDTNGKKHTQNLIITKRDYNIDKITGVAKKYVSPPKSVSERISREAVAVRNARAVNSDLTYFLDIANKTGSPVYAPIGGTVVFAEPDLYYSGGTLILDHGHGITSTYIHLSKLDVNVGDKVKQGNKVAEIGATGRVTGPHLDWRFNWKGERLDPGLLMQDTLANKK